MYVDVYVVVITSVVDGDDVAVVVGVCVCRGVDVVGDGGVRHANVADEVTIVVVDNGDVCCWLCCYVWCGHCVHEC